MRFGAGLVVSEMVASDEFVRGSEEARLRAEGEGIHPHVIQLAGCDARLDGGSGPVGRSLGAQIIDINMGCPAKRVTGGYAGSALMRDLDHAARLIAAAVSAVSIPVTVKMRLGWDERSLNAPELARRARGVWASRPSRFTAARASSFTRAPPIGRAIAGGRGRSRHPGDRQWRYLLRSRMRGGCLRASRRERRHGRAGPQWAGPG